MGTTVTQTRSLPVQPWVTYRNNAVLGSGTSAGFYTQQPSQTTTSYRSGKAVVGPSDEDVADTLILSGGKVFDTFGHLRHEEREKSASSYDNGHNFYTKKVETVHENGLVTVPNLQVGAFVYGGSSVIYPLGTTVYGGSNVHAIVPSWDHTYYGTEAIKSAKPTNPSVSLLTTLTEIYREGFTSLGGSIRSQGKVSSLRDAGSNYLAYEFGWKPLLDEIVGTMHAVDNASRIIDQYIRDHGRLVRRKRKFRDIITTDAREYFGSAAFATSTTSLRPFNPLSGTTIQSARFIDATNTVQRIKFSGGFTYYIPHDPGFLGQMKRYERLANRLLGTSITPEVLWNVAPWSWLVDWNVNVGSYIANLTSFQSDGLLLKYGYIMRETSSIRRIIMKGVAPRSHAPRDYVTTFSVHQKERYRANPYGFSTNPNTYSERQWAILGALGMTKGPRSLFG